MTTSDDLQFEIENSALATADLDGFLPGQVSLHRVESGHRGLLTEILIGGVLNGATAGGVSVVLVGLWNALRSHRERQLREIRSVPVVLSIEDGDTRVEIPLELRGDMSDAVRTVEVEMARAGLRKPHRVRVRLSG